MKLLSAYFLSGLLFRFCADKSETENKGGQQFKQRMQRNAIHAKGWNGLNTYVALKPMTQAKL